ncbi:hypothetical protein [Streptomyces sp. NPDC054783]
MRGAVRRPARPDGRARALHLTVRGGPACGTMGYEDGLAVARALAPSGESHRRSVAGGHVPHPGRNPSLRPLVFGQITHIAELAELPVDP